MLPNKLKDVYSVITMLEMMFKHFSNHVFDGNRDIPKMGENASRHDERSFKKS